jgi:hypothetical protein
VKNKFSTFFHSHHPTESDTLKTRIINFNFLLAIIVPDGNYNYFYKVLKQDNFGRTTSYISGNGLVTKKDYDESSVLNSVETGYNYKLNPNFAIET